MFQPRAKTFDSCAACIRLLAHRGRSGGLSMAAARPRDRPLRRDKCIYGSDTCDSRQDSSLEHRYLLCRSVLAAPARWLPASVSKAANDVSFRLFPVVVE